VEKGTKERKTEINTGAFSGCRRTRRRPYHSVCISVINVLFRVKENTHFSALYLVYVFTSTSPVNKRQNSKIEKAQTDMRETLEETEKQT